MAVAKLELIQAASRARARALGQQRPVQRAQRGVNPVEVAAPVRREETVGQADLVDGEPGVALQVDLEVAVRDRRHAFSKEATRSANDGRLDCCDGGAAGDIFASRTNECGTGKQLLAQEAERRSHPRFQLRSALRSA